MKVTVRLNFSPNANISSFVLSRNNLSITAPFPFLACTYTHVSKGFNWPKIRQFDGDGILGYEGPIFYVEV